MKFKVIDLKDEGAQFTVTIMKENGEREAFTFEKGQGYETKIGNEPAWLLKIKNLLSERESKKAIKVAPLTEEIKKKNFEV